MNKTILFSVIASLFLSTLEANAYEVTSVDIKRVDIPKELYVNYQGDNKNFKSGFPTGYGSALAFNKVNKDGTVEFFALTDRGPNADGPKYEKDGKIMSGKFFPASSFQPSIALLKLAKGKVSIEKVIPLKNKDDSMISGLPVNFGKIGNSGEVALDEKLNVLPYDDNGLDPEGLDVDINGHFWISDEYGPFAIEFDENGKLIRKLAPGDGLPELFKYRTPNRGAEGLTLTPNGTLVVMEQSILNLKKLNKSSNKTAKFCRIAFINLKTGKIKTIGYPIDFEAYKKPGDAKLGDIVAINDNEFLIIEQGKDKNKKMRNLVYKFDVTDAQDISDLLINDKEPEFLENIDDLKLASKELVVDLREHGWKAEKAEGMTILPDHKTIALINDNDFGVALKLTDDENKKAKIGDYVYHLDGSFTLNGKKANPKIELVKNSPDESEINLFLVKLDKKLN